MTDVKIIPERKPAAHKKHNDIDHQVIYDITRADQNHRKLNIIRVKSFF